MTVLIDVAEILHPPPKQACTSEAGTSEVRPNGSTRHPWSKPRWVPKILRVVSVPAVGGIGGVSGLPCRMWVCGVAAAVMAIPHGGSPGIEVEEAPRGCCCELACHRY
jgi:hypothetical protein